MTQKRAEEVARGLIVVGGLVMFVAFALVIDTLKGGRTGVRGGVFLWFAGWLFFAAGGGLGAGSTRESNVISWLFFASGGGAGSPRGWKVLSVAFLLLGAVLIGLSVVWLLRGPNPEVVAWSPAVAGLGIVIEAAALLWWIRLQRTVGSV